MKLTRPLVALGLATALVAATGTPVSSAPPRYREYVALGDSWTADVLTSLPPTTRFVPLDCAQSRTDYPHQVAAALAVETFRDASCGSATSAHMTTPQALPLGGVNPPQFDRLTATTDLVTLGIGGNDIGLAAAVTTCLNLLPVDLLGLPAPLGRPCTGQYTAGGVDQFAQAIAATEPKIVTVLQQIRARSPKADVFLVNYLNGLPADGRGCWPVVPVTDGDMAYLQRTFVAMNAMLARAAKAGRATLVDTYAPTLGHDVCKPPGVAHVEGLVPLSLTNPLLLAFPFHPNQLGADAQARIVRAAVERH